MAKKWFTADFAGTAQTTVVRSVLASIRSAPTRAAAPSRPPGSAGHGRPLGSTFGSARGRAAWHRAGAGRPGDSTHPSAAGSSMRPVARCEGWSCLIARFRAQARRYDGEATHRSVPTSLVGVANDQRHARGEMLDNPESCGRTWGTCSACRGVTERGG
jgi:hypothetical protein